LTPVFREFDMTRIYAVRQASNGVTLWTGAAVDERGALDAMAREAGYTDFEALPADVRGAEPRAEPLRF
jgi:hypothetical protein